MRADSESQWSDAWRTAVIVPWALAILSALAAAWFGARFIVAQSENRVLAQREALLSVSLKAIETRIEAEDIVGRRLAADAAAHKAPGNLPALQLLISRSRVAPDAVGAVAWNPDGTGGVLVGRALPATRPGEQYELWTAGEVATKAGTFTVDHDGGAQVPFTVSSPLPAGTRFEVLRPGSTPGARLEVLLSR